MVKLSEKNKISVWRILQQMVSIYLEKHISRSAAEFAYFLTLSIFPMLICLNAMLGNMFPTADSLLDFAEGMIPDGSLGIIVEYLGYITDHSGAPMLTAALAVMATSAAAIFRSIHNIMGEIQGKPRYKGPFALLSSFIFSLVFLAVMYFGVVVVFAGNWFLGFLNEHLGIDISYAWTWMRFILLFCILLFIIYGIYRMTAPKSHVHPLMIGALAASFTLVGASIFFSWFIGMSARYPLIYGSLASFVILMIWLYMCGNILIMGNVLNVALRSERERIRSLAEANENIGK